jgi:hypothetical protein
MAQQAVNIHSGSIDKKIQKIKKGDRWQTVIGTDSTHETIIRDFSDCIFTNLIHDTFSRAYMKKYPCSDCGQPSTDRCHGKGEERPILLKRAMELVWPDITKPIVLKDIVVAFLVGNATKTKRIRSSPRQPTAFRAYTHRKSSK